MLVLKTTNEKYIYAVFVIFFILLLLAIHSPYIAQKYYLPSFYDRTDLSTDFRLQEVGGTIFKLWDSKEIQYTIVSFFTLLSSYILFNLIHNKENEKYLYIFLLMPIIIHDYFWFNGSLLSCGSLICIPQYINLIIFLLLEIFKLMSIWFILRFLLRPLLK